MSDQKNGVGTMEQEFEALGLDPKSTQVALESMVNFEPGQRVFPTGGKMQGEGPGLTEQTQQVLDEGVRIVKTKRMTGVEKAKKRKYRKTHKSQIKKTTKAWERKGQTKTHKRKVKALQKITKGRKLGPRRRRQYSGMDQVANLAEQINGILRSVTAPKQNDRDVRAHIEAMERAATVTAMLAEEFELADDKEAAAALERLASKANEIAEALEQGRKSVADLDESMKKVLSGVASAMDAYDALEEQEEKPKDDEKKDEPEKDDEDKPKDKKTEQEEPKGDDDEDDDEDDEKKDEKKPESESKKAKKEAREGN